MLQEQSTNKKANLKRLGIKILSDYRSVLILIIMLGISAIMSADFLNMANLYNVLRQIAVAAIVGAGMTFVILTGGIDLSVGSILGLSGVVSASVLIATENTFLAVLAGLGIGFLCGLLNGIFIAKLRIPAFIATLGMMTLLRGVILVYTEGSPVSVTKESFKFIGKGTVIGIPMAVLLIILAYVLGFLLLHYTRFGREVYALGGNREAARLSGIPVVKTEMKVYIINGVLSALAGIVLTARLGSAQSTGGAGIEMDAIAAVILGGTSLSGGTGFVLPTVVGAMIIGLIDNILTLMNVSPHATQIVKGAVILIAVLIDKKAKDLSKKV